MKRFCMWSGLASATLAAWFPSVAYAVESSVPTFSGLTIGLTQGVTPPPGIYFSDANVIYSAPKTDPFGNKLPTHLTLDETVPTLTVATDLKILGGRYTFTIAQGYEATSVTSNAVLSTQAAGLFNTYIVPVDLGYRLGEYLFARVSVGGFLPDGNYDSVNRHIANGFATIVPNLGITYLRNGFAATVYTRLNVNFNNPYTNYHTGNISSTEYLISQSVNHFTAGVGGYLTAEITNDVHNGVIVPATATNSIGNKSFQFAIGPYASYDFGKFAVSLTYTHDLVSRNYYRADAGFVRVSFPLGNPFTSSQPVAPSQIPDRLHP